MAISLYEHILVRAFAYLAAMDIPVNRETSLDVLGIVEAVLSADTAEPMAAVMEQLSRRFAVSLQSLPPSFPAIQRGSIGYEAY